MAKIGLTIIGGAAIGKAASDLNEPWLLNLSLLLWHGEISRWQGSVALCAPMNMACIALHGR